MKKSAFIITKPIQYVNATNIPDANSRECLLVNSFHNVLKFKTIVEQQATYWDKVSFFSTRQDAVKYVIQHKDKYERLYVDSDFGIVLGFYLKKLDPVQLYTYEEGYASYSFIRKPSSIKEKVKIWIANMLQLKNWVGAHSVTRGMYLYQPEKFKKNIGDFKPIFAFRKPFMEQVFSLPEIQVLLGNIEEDSFDGKDVLLYLTSWKVHPLFEEYIKNGSYDYKVIKPHPHIRGDVTFFRFDLVVDNYVPAELLIKAIMTNCKSLTVLHQGSFALEYFTIGDKLKEILLK